MHLEECAGTLQGPNHVLEKINVKGAWKAYRGAVGTWGKSSGAERSEQSCEEWICIEREQGGYFCGGNRVSPGSRSDMKGVCHDNREEEEELGGMGPNCRGQ